MPTWPCMASPYCTSSRSNIVHSRNRHQTVHSHNGDGEAHQDVAEQHKTIRIAGALRRDIGSVATRWPMQNYHADRASSLTFDVTMSLGPLDDYTTDQSLAVKALIMIVMMSHDPHPRVNILNRLCTMTFPRLLIFWPPKPLQNSPCFFGLQTFIFHVSFSHLGPTIDWLIDWLIACLLTRSIDRLIDWRSQRSNTSSRLCDSPTTKWNHLSMWLK